MLKNFYSDYPYFESAECDFCDEPSVVQIWDEEVEYQAPICLCARHAAQLAENTKHFDQSKM